MPNTVTPPSGKQYELKAGDFTATICSIGAAVRQLRRGDQDIFVPFAADEVSPVYNAAILAPWPNRLDGGTYEFDGYQGQLPVNELDRQNALHGLVCWDDWDLVSHDDASVTLQLDIPARPGWPFQLRLTVNYWLVGGSGATTEVPGLHCRVTATNIGAQTAPYGVGFHPWLSSGAFTLDECDIRLDANQHITVDDRLLPTGTEPVDGDYDLRERRSLRGLDLDDAWVEPTYGADGKSWCILYRPKGGNPAIWADDSLPAWQVCTADHIPNFHRFGLAAEPMTCVADAFNTKDLLIELKPGASHEVLWGATLLP